MARHELMLRLDSARAPDAASATHGDEAQRLRLSIYEALGLKVRSHAWVTIPLGTPKADRVLEALRAELARGHAFVGDAKLFEILEAGDESDADWSVLATRHDSYSFNLSEDYPQCRAGTLPKVHAMNATFVSEAFVAACRRFEFRGIDFLRCRNSGRKPGAPWYVALPAHGLGNGLDHPWLERRPWLAHVGNDSWKRSSSPRVGQNVFHQFWLRKAALEEPLVASLLQLCPMPAAPQVLAGLTFVMVPRFLARAQPDADFAYLPWGEDGPNRDGKMLRFRELAVRRRARRLLAEAGLFKETDFRSMRSVVDPEPWVEVLDDLHAPAPPMYTAEELRQLRKLEPA